MKTKEKSRAEMIPGYSALLADVLPCVVCGEDVRLHSTHVKCFAKMAQERPETLGKILDEVLGYGNCAAENHEERKMKVGRFEMVWVRLALLMAGKPVKTAN